MKTNQPKPRPQQVLERIRTRARGNGTLKYLESKPTIDNRQGPQNPTRETLLARFGMHIEGEQ